MNKIIRDIVVMGKKAAVFLPSNITGLSLWLKQGTGLFQDAAKTTPSVANSDVVGAWADQSTNAKDVTQATTGLKPLLKTNIINGLSAVLFDGSDDRLINADFALNQPSTIFVVGKVAASDNPASNFFDSLASVQSQFYSGYTSLNPGKFVPCAGAAGTFLSKNIGFNAHCVVFNGANSGHYIGPKYASLSNLGTNAFSGLSVGNIRGNPNPLTNYFDMNGYIAELIIYNTALSDANRNLVFNYLINKYNLRQIIFDGNSMTYGTGAAPYTTDYPTQVCALLGSNYAAINFGVPSQTTVDMTNDAVAQIDPLYSTPFSRILCCWEGTNDIYVNNVNGQTAYDNLVTYCAARRSAGYKVVILNIIKRSTITGAKETARTDCNALIASNWATFADAYADVASAAELQDTANATYYSDGTHLTAAGYAVVAAIVKTAIDTL